MKANVYGRAVDPMTKWFFLGTVSVKSTGEITALNLTKLGEANPEFLGVVLPGLAKNLSSDKQTSAFTLGNVEYELSVAE